MKKEVRILMIDDDDEDFIIIRDIVAEIKNWKAIIDWVPSYAEGLKVINEKKHDVYLVDFRLGINLGTDLIIEAIKNGCEAPLILMTGQNDVETDEKALSAGAADYLVKGTISANMLERSIRYSIEHSKNLTEIKHLNADLEQRVKSRTMILEEAMHELNKTKEELNIALQKEKDLNEMKTRFVSMASHEFRTPLSTILSSASLISQYWKEEHIDNRKKHIDRIKSSVTNLTDILNDFLSLDKLEQGKTEIEKQIFNLDEFSEDIVEEINGILKTGQKIYYKHTGPREIEQDKKILKNVFFNLLSNASKYSGDNKNIYLNTEVHNNSVSVKVKDEGMGIPEEEQKNLFEKFFRAKNVSNIQGTGLGLNIVKRYVELMNGSISFTSTPEEGTIFTIEFPNK